MAIQWEGGWSGTSGLSQISYYEGDIVSYENIAYIVQKDVSIVPIGSQAPPLDMTNWDVFAAGATGATGTSGTSGTSGSGGISSADQIHWVNGNSDTISAGEIVTIGSDHMLIDSELYIQGPVSDGYGSSIEISGKPYNRDGKLSIFGDFVVYDSIIENDGQIRVDEGFILEGDCTIIGNGIII
jgi:hypothetical protein